MARMVMYLNCIGLAAGLDVRILIYCIADRDRLDTTHETRVRAACGWPAARPRARARLWTRCSSARAGVAPGAPRNGHAIGVRALFDPAEGRDCR